MNIYKVCLSESYQFFSGLDSQKMQKFEKNDFSEIDKIRFSLDSKDRPNVGDITTVATSCCLAFSKKAQKVFSGLSFVNLNDTDFCICNIPEIDALDMENSQIDYFQDTKKLKRIRKYSFNIDVVGNHICFKLPIIASPVFVTQKFVDKYLKEGFKGVDFVKVYESK